MPGKRAPKGKSNVAQVEEQVRGIYYTDNEAVWGGFINIRLDDEQKSSFYAWYEDNHPTISKLLEDAICEGVKHGLAYDGKHQTFISTFTGALVLNSTERYVSTSRAGTMLEAIGLAVWKHFVLCDGDYGNYKPSNSAFLTWG